MIAISTVLFLLIVLFLIAAKCKAHERETGLPPPSREIQANIRRDANERGIPERQVYSDCLAQEQRKRKY
jgi:hypothetical protein